MKTILHNGRTFIICLLFSTGSMNLAAQTPELFADINSNGDSSPSNLTFLDNSFVFRAIDNLNGDELWISDGTVSGTQMVKDINPSGDSYPINFINRTDIVYFVADDGVNGRELWLSTGTENGTYMVKDINPTGSSVPDNLIKFDGHLFFTADDGVIGKELWLSNGNANGTSRVKDINPNGSASVSNLFVYNNKLYFSANDGTNGTELWVSDGSTAGTVMLKNINATSDSNPAKFTELNGLLYFRANDGINGYELWVTDGTEAGTQLFIDIASGANDSYPYNFYVSGNKMYFSAQDPVHYEELWVSDGTVAGTYMVKDIYPDDNGSSPSYFMEFNGKVYFQATDGTHAEEFWVTDGTEPGTYMVKDINTTTQNYEGSFPDNFTVYNNKLYFAANDGTGDHLWVTDGTEAGTVKIAPATYDEPTSVNDLFLFEDALYFQAEYSNAIGKELYKYSDPCLAYTTPPNGEENQTLNQGEILADLVVEGENLVWYSDENLTHEIPDTTVAVDATTYYVTQSNGNCVSPSLGILVTVNTLSINDLASQDIQIFPNPTKDILTLKIENQTIEKITLISVSGQRLKSWANQNSINLSAFPAGNYFIQITTSRGTLTKAIIKN